jgi:hypothetical protein
MMSEDVNLNLADRLQYRVNHEKWLVETNDPTIYLCDRGRGFEPHIRNFVLYWSGREIGVRAHWDSYPLGKNAKGQQISDTHWTVHDFGHADHTTQGRVNPYIFKSQQERICAANLIIKALSAFGGTTNKPEWNVFPEYRTITAKLSEPLRSVVYGGLN